MLEPTLQHGRILHENIGSAVSHRSDNRSAFTNFLVEMAREGLFHLFFPTFIANEIELSEIDGWLLSANRVVAVPIAQGTQYGRQIGDGDLNQAMSGSTYI